MFDRKIFRSKVVAAGMTLEAVAKEMDINPSTLDRKMSGVSDFTRKEMQTLRKILNLTAEDMDGIFFAEELT